MVYATRTDLEGNPLELKLSALLQNGNSEQKAGHRRRRSPEITYSPSPLWCGFPAAAGAAQTKT
ncbi:MAG: hypothetical protein ACLU9S_03645 [Oscillospiraceae bacterium]